MDQFGVSALADWLETESDAILEKKTILDLDQVYAAVDYLGVLKNQASAYSELHQETYLKSESDKKLSLLEGNQTLAASSDRIMVNHVAGSVTDDEIEFTYNHDTPYDKDGYKARKDLEILKFGLEVVGAVSTTGHIETVRAALSADAVVTFILSATALHAWQLA